MNIDRILLEKLERLSHLHIQEEKKETLLEQLNEIIGFMENLSECDTQGLDPHFSTLTGGTPLRKDEPRSDREVVKNILDHAPHSEDDFFIVPAIIE